MTKMIDRATGVSMWVADNRVEEYLAAGHKLAASPVAIKPIEEPKVEDVPEVKETKKTSRKK
jgi:hypothetical protein